MNGIGFGFDRIFDLTSLPSIVTDAEWGKYITPIEMREEGHLRFTAVETTGSNEFVVELDPHNSPEYPDPCTGLVYPKRFFEQVKEVYNLVRTLVHTYSLCSQLVQKPAKKEEKKESEPQRNLNEVKPAEMFTRPPTLLDRLYEYELELLADDEPEEDQASWWNNTLLQHRFHLPPDNSWLASDAKPSSKSKPYIRFIAEAFCNVQGLSPTEKARAWLGALREARDDYQPILEQVTEEIQNVDPSVKVQPSERWIAPFCLPRISAQFSNYPECAEIKKEIDEIDRANKELVLSALTQFFPLLDNNTKLTPPQKVELVAHFTPFIPVMCYVLTQDEINTFISNRNYLATALTLKLKFKAFEESIAKETLEMLDEIFPLREVAAITDEERERAEDRLLQSIPVLRNLLPATSLKGFLNAKDPKDASKTRSYLNQVQL